MGGQIIRTRTDDILDQGREEGREEGRKEGREEGRKEGREKAEARIAANLLRTGRMSHEEIAQLTGVAEEEVGRIAKEMKTPA